MVELKEIKIGNQIWASQNLDIVNFNNGDLIIEARDSSRWVNEGKKGNPCWCHYNNSKINSSYGKIYNRNVLFDSRNILPKDWRVPTIADFENLQSFLKEQHVDYPSDTLKSKRGWEMDNNGNNKSGFCARPGGYRLFDGKFENIGWSIWFWLLDGKFEISADSYSYGSSHDLNGAYIRLIR